MNLFKLFSRTQSAPAARERLQVLLAHERASTGGSDIVAKLRDERGFADLPSLVAQMDEDARQARAALNLINASERIPA